jgi:Ferredoxin-dependent bilin reductase
MIVSVLREHFDLQNQKTMVQFGNWRYNQISLPVIFLVLISRCHSFQTSSSNVLQQGPNNRHHRRERTISQSLSPHSINEPQQTQQHLTCRMGVSCRMVSSLKEEDTADAVDPNNQNTIPGKGSGLYRTFADTAWQQLMMEAPYLSIVPIPTDLCYKETIQTSPKQNNDNTTAQTTSTVRITLQAAMAAQGDKPKSSAIQYARFALIETIDTSPSNNNDEDMNQEDANIDGTHANSHSNGIQVLNMVVVPFPHTGLPVFGADFVTLPGNKHLLLLDAQPVRGNNRNNNTSSGSGSCNTDMDNNNNNPTEVTTHPTNTNHVDNDTLYDNWFQSWYVRNHIQQRYSWGGDLPEPVQQYVSKYALWTRLGTGSRPKNVTTTTTTTTTTSNDVTSTTPLEGPVQSDPIEMIQGPIMELFMDHFHTYIQLLNHYESSNLEQQYNHPDSRLLNYLQYRLDNDPARPMLKRLFGANWTEQALHDVLFPIHIFQ